MILEVWSLADGRARSVYLRGCSDGMSFHVVVCVVSSHCLCRSSPSIQFAQNIVYGRNAAVGVRGLTCLDEAVLVLRTRSMTGLVLRGRDRAQMQGLVGSYILTHVSLH